MHTSVKERSTLQFFLYVAFGGDRGGFLRKSISLFLIALSMSPMPSFASEYGTFIGTVKAEWLEDGRKMKLLEDFSYVDQFRNHWNAPKD